MMRCLNRILVSRLVLAASAVAIGLAASVLVGCGQQGPLYLPTEAAAAKRATLPQTLRPGSAADAPTAPLANPTPTTTPAPLAPPAVRSPAVPNPAATP